MASFKFTPTISLDEDKTEYRLLTDKYVSKAIFEGKEILKIEPEGLTLLAKEAMHDVSFYLRTSHLEQVSKILDDPEASDNDRFVALTLLQNSVVAAEGELPTCQDTGTAIVIGKKGQQVFTGGEDEKSLSFGVYKTYQDCNLRYSQIAPLTMFNEKNTGDNLPAQIELYATSGNTYEFLFLAKGGGSANKTFLYQETKSLLTEENLEQFIQENLPMLGTAGCPPYHLSLVIGGTSPEANLKTVKLASAGYLDGLPKEGNERGQGFRDIEWEKKVEKIAVQTKIGAQFGGKYFVHDVRVIRLPRHAASCPVGLGVSCSADRNIKGKITHEGIFLEVMEKNPARFIADRDVDLPEPVKIDLDQPIDDVLRTLSKYPIKTRLSLSGTMIVARDMAHLKLMEQLEKDGDLPAYFKDHPIYYAGPAKTPKGMVSGSFGPTTAGRMDPYTDLFMSVGASKIMVAKGNRSASVRDACKKYGGFYLGSIGGPAAILAKENILNVEVVDFPEMEMEAVRKIKVKNFPAFIICDDKGNDFFNYI